MKDGIRSGFLIAAALACTLAAALPCAAQTYPAKPVLVLMPLQAGSAVDVMIRIVAQKMSEGLGQQIVIENQPGAAGSIGAERVKRAAPDGYTIGALNDSILTMIPNIRNVGYDPLRDFEPVGVVAAISWVMVVNNDLPAKSVPEFVALAKKSPGRLDYSSGGNGSPQHVAMEVFATTAGITLTHVPYRGATQAALDVASGQVTVAFQGLSTVASLARSGKLRLLAVTTRNRLPQFPDVPTISESGLPGFEFNSWFALMAPARTPKPIIARLNEEVQKALADPEVRERLNAQGLTIQGSSPEELGTATRAQLAKYARVMKEANIKNE